VAKKAAGYYRPACARRNRRVGGTRVYYQSPDDVEATMRSISVDTPFLTPSPRTQTGS